MKVARCQRFLTLILMFSLFFISMPFGKALGNDNNGGASQNEALIKKASDNGHVKVIVRLAVPGIEAKTEASRSFRSVSPGQIFSSDAVQADLALAQIIESEANTVLQSLDATEYVVNHTYSTIPFLAMDVSSKALSVLRSMPSVLSIVEDIPVKVNESFGYQEKSMGDPSVGNATVSPNLKLIGADVAWDKGYTGAGWYVAILDTGIRAGHEMFQGKTIAEACFSSNSDCPNQSTEMTGTGSAEHYYDYNFSRGYDHGTHVSGIAAGNSSTISGVAKDAGIIAIQVFSRFSGYEGCLPDSNCVLSFRSDQLKGLEYVYALRGSYSIAAVNMSIGGGQYNAYCDDSPLKSVIDNLRGVGIATIIASGNEKICGAISAPACISSAVSVGATDYDDAETYFSNWHPTLVDFFAPGFQIYSATAASDVSYEYWNGTSMAAPHVTGAWALMKQCESGGDVAELYNAIKETGKMVTTRCGEPNTRPRINVGSAICYLKGILPAPVLSASVSGTSVTISWNEVPTADNYILHWGPHSCYSWEASHQTPVGNKTTITAEVPANSYYVAVKAYNDAGSSDYSNVELFVIVGNTAGCMPRK